MFGMTVSVFSAENGVTAHRGNSGEYPENSIPAFRSAARLGVDWIETDIFKTSDNRIVICHDAQTKHVADIDLNIVTSTLEQLRKLDMAYGFRKSKQLTETECLRLAVLTLEDVLPVILEFDSVRLSIQPKNDCVDQAIEIVRKFNAVSRIGFNDGNLKLMARVKELEPSIPVFWDRFEWSEGDIVTANKHGFESIVLHFSNVTAERVTAVHQAGMKFGVWTVNDPALMKKYLKMGVDRIYTDQPRLLLGLKKENEIGFE
jgi:glycerophosphoryl diester phosphodiesterase